MSLYTTAELATAAALLPESDGGSPCVHPASRAGSVTVKTMATPVRSFARRMTHYLQAPCTSYEWRCVAKFCGDTIVHTMFILAHEWPRHFARRDAEVSVEILRVRAEIVRTRSADSVTTNGVFLSDGCMRLAIVFARECPQAAFPRQSIRYQHRPQR
jgi:hypothetical protein